MNSQLLSQHHKCTSAALLPPMISMNSASDVVLLQQTVSSGSRYLKVAKKIQSSNSLSFFFRFLTNLLKFVEVNMLFSPFGLLALVNRLTRQAWVYSWELWNILLFYMEVCLLLFYYSTELFNSHNL